MKVISRNVQRWQEWPCLSCSLPIYLVRCLSLDAHSVIIASLVRDHSSMPSVQQLYGYILLPSIHRILKLCPTTTAQTTPMSRFYLIPESDNNLHRLTPVSLCKLLKSGVQAVQWICSLFYLYM